MAGGPCQAQRAPTGGALEVAILEPVYATLFGSRVYLGIDLIVLMVARIADGDGDEVRLIPADEDAAVVVTLQHPDLAPPEAARPRDIAGHARVLVRPVAT